MSCAPARPWVDWLRMNLNHDTELRLGHIPLLLSVELVRIDLPEHEMEPLLERGILPGCALCPVRFSPWGDPVLLVDGALIALRRR